MPISVPAGAFAGDEIEMRRIAAHDHAQGDDSVVGAGRDQLARRQRQLETTGDREHLDRLRGDAAITQAAPCAVHFQRERNPDVD